MLEPGEPHDYALFAPRSLGAAARAWDAVEAFASRVLGKA